MKDLIEFMRARLDEDERRCKTHDEPADWCDPANGIHRDADWIRADITAKRAVVDMCETAGKLDSSTWLARYATLTRVLRHLSTPYANHPDYQASNWAPRPEIH